MLNRDELAERCGIHSVTLWQIENGRSPRTTTIRGLLKGLGLTPKEACRLKILMDVMFDDVML